MSFNTGARVQHRNWNLLLNAANGPAPLNETFYFGLTPFPFVGPDPVPIGPALDARNTYFNTLQLIKPNAAGTVTFTLATIEENLNSTPITVPFYGGTPANSVYIQSPVKRVINFSDDGSGFSGRFNTTSFADIVAQRPNGTDPNVYYQTHQTYIEFQSLFEVTFATPVDTFGFYGTDWGDFAGRPVIRINYADATFTDNYIPDNEPYPDSNLIFWGVIANKKIVGFSVFLDPPNQSDFFGVDDIIAAIL